MFVRTCARHSLPCIPRARHRARSGNPAQVALFLAAVSLLLLFPHPAGAAELIVVNITVNDEGKGDLFVLRQEGGALLLPADDLSALGLQVPREAALDLAEGRYVDLCRLPGVTCRFREEDLTLRITVPSSYLPKTETIVGARTAKAGTIYRPRDTSLFLNYGMNYLYQDPAGFQAFTLASKAGVRHGDLLFLNDALYTKTAEYDDAVRLLSSVTYERRDSLQWLIAGDSFASSGELGSTVNMGGLSFQKIYGMDPNFIRQPTMTLAGVAAFPSEAFVYLDGRLVSTYRIQPGEFELRDFYYHTGSHDIELVIKDAFGGEQRISTPRYFSDLLLRQGLHEYSYHLGYLREQYGVLSNDYGDPVFSGFHRYGLNGFATLGARAEATKGVVNGGIESSLAVPRSGVFIIGLAQSEQEDRRGSAGSLHHVYLHDRFSTDLLVRRFSRDYATVLTRGAPAAVRREGSLTAQYAFPAWGAVALGYALAERYDAPGPATRVLSASVSRSFRHQGSLTASIRRVAASGTDYEVFVGYTYSGREPYFSASAQRARDSNNESVQVYNRTPIGEGVGYRASLARSEFESRTVYTFNPAVQYNAPYGIYALDSRIQSGSGDPADQHSLSVSGSLVYVDGFFGVSRPVNDGFSLVMTGQTAGVPVLVNNQSIGETDGAGMLVVPTIKSYYDNQVSIDAKNIPMDFGMGGVNTVIAPSQWSGSCVSFEVNRLQAVTGMLSVVQDGKTVPLEYYDVAVEVDGRQVRFQTGRAGEFYLENLLPADRSAASPDPKSCRAIRERRLFGGGVIPPGGYPATVDYQGQRCSFTLTFPITDEVMTDLGAVRCFLPPLKDLRP